MAEYYEAQDGRAASIPYPALADKLFSSKTDRTQKLGPFLGAGASLGSRAPWDEPEAKYPPPDVAERLCSELGWSGTTKRFVELALRLAAKIDAAEKTEKTRTDPVSLARESKYPPSASDLAAALASVSAFDGFERPKRQLRGLLTADDREVAALLRWIATLTEIGPSVPPLLSVASYYEFTLQRAQLWDDLREIFKNKKTPTCTHWLIARAAEHHLALRPRKDFLIITTNYDQLMEIALQRSKVPYCVLTVGNKDSYVDLRFSPGIREYLELNEDEFDSLKAEHANKYPKGFTLDLPRKVAIVYKLHGCLFPEQPRRDSVVLSDEDYIRYLMQMNDATGMIPGEITALTATPSFLFLGYSFSDWNVRGMYKALIRQRTLSLQQEVKDFAVVREFSLYESAFCREGNGRINLLVTDLRKFARRMMALAPPRPKMRVLETTA